MYTLAEIDSWRQMAIDAAAEFGLELEVAESFDKYLELGNEPPEAARCALYEWDC